MQLLSTIDWIIIIFFFAISLGIGIYAAMSSENDSESFFLGARKLPWWLLGVSMVATTFSADTPNLVTDIVRQNGVSGNWVWWTYLLTGMLTVFVYAKLWRRSGVMTDLEFYELRYNKEIGSFLRGFRALYLGVVFNVLIMATVCLAGIKIGDVLLGFSAIKTLLLASIVTVIYAGIGGLKGIVLTDFLQFILAMIGTVAAAYFILQMPEIGGLDGLLANEVVRSKIAIFPDPNNWELMISLLIIPLAVQWWASYYPGSEPGGGGYIAQRMLAAKNEKHAIAATLLYNAAHYALRPWPWIIIALASLVIFPDLQSLEVAFPHVEKDIVKHDLAYPAMMSLLPNGLLGVIVASLIAAFMSTISTHLNWGSSYVTHDFYHRFINPKASQAELVNVARINTLLLMVLAAIAALYLKNAKEAFDIIVLVGAGTGLIYILRWFWWRINAFSELSAMIVSFIIAYYFKFHYGGDMPGHFQLLTSVGLTTICWLAVTFMTQPTDNKILASFYNKIKPYPGGWKRFLDRENIEIDQQGKQNLGLELIAMLAGSLLVYSVLFSTGYFIYGQYQAAIIFLVIALMMAIAIRRLWTSISV